MSAGPVSDTSQYWERQPYGVVLGKQFGDYEAALKAAVSLMLDTNEDAETAIRSGYGDALIDSNKSDSVAGASAKVQYQAPSYGDASIFGNDVMNPYAGFCRDDDICRDMYQYSKDTSKEVDSRGQPQHDVFGLGRVYAEKFDHRQQVVYFQFGIPKYRNLQAFIYGASDATISDANELGEVDMIQKISKWLISTVKFAFELPFIPLEFGWRFLTDPGMVNDVKITEYFYFDPRMGLYFDHVNSILAVLAVNMGIYWPDNETEKLRESMPLIIRNGPDIKKILSFRSSRYDVDTEAATDKEKWIEKEAAKKPGEVTITQQEGSIEHIHTVKTMGEGFWKAVGTTLLDANQFIAFRLEKGSDNASETFSNTLQESQLQQRLNEAVSSQRSIDRGLASQGGGAFAWVAEQAKRFKAFKDNVAALFSGSSAGIGQFVAYTAAGNGYYDLPQMWAGSNYTRSVSINIRLRAKTGGDPVSIFTSIMVPLSCLMAAAMPRAGGNASYVSPFILRAWCRGMFNIPAGIVQSLSISRGDSEYGWSITKQPTVVSVSMQIADLSPILFLSLAGSGGLLELFSNNSKLLDYLATLSGIGTKQRAYLMQNWKRGFKSGWLKLKQTWFSSAWYGTLLGESPLGNIASLVVPAKYTRGISDNH